MHQKHSQRVEISKIFWGSMPPDPPRWAVGICPLPNCCHSKGLSPPTIATCSPPLLDPYQCMKEVSCSLSYHEQTGNSRYRLIYSITVAARLYVHLTECACVKACCNSSDNSNTNYFRVLFLWRTLAKIIIFLVSVKLDVIRYCSVI